MTDRTPRYDTDSDDTIEADVDNQSVSTEDVETEDANASGEVTGNFASKHYATFSMEYLENPFGGGYSDPLIFDKTHFADGEYRALVLTNDTNQNELWKSPALDPSASSWSQINASYLESAASWGSGRQFQDHFVLPDGTFVLYDSQEADSSTNVWTGDTLDSVTKLGTAVGDFSDCGVFYDESDDTIHIYPEGVQFEDTPSSDYIKHFTTPADDLLNSTQQSDAIDLSGVAWHTGDVEVIEYGDFYYMFMDMSYDHVPYEIAVARSPDLYNWEVASQSIMSSRLGGGDLAVTKVGNIFYGFTEYTVGSVGLWRVHPHSPTGTVEAPGNNVTFNTKDGGQVAEFNTSTNGQNDFNFHVHPQQSGRSQSINMLSGNDDTIFRLGDVGPTGGFLWGSEGFELKDTTFNGSVFIRDVVELFGSGTKSLVAEPDGSVSIPPQDLSALSLGSSADGRIYRHDGANSISADGGTTSSPGYYAWDNSASEFKSIVQF